MRQKIEQIITDAANDCYDIPNDFYLLQKEPGKYILNELEKAGYKVIKQDKVIDV